MSEIHRQYELAYVVSPTVTDDGVNELHERISEIVQQLGGTVDNTDVWGRRRLAYEINRHREGTYVIVLITGPGDMVTELERRLRVMEQLLRHLVIRVDEVMRKAAHRRSRRQGRQGRRRVKGAPPAVETAPAAPAATDTETAEEAAEPVAAAAEAPAPEAAAASDAQPEDTQPEPAAEPETAAEPDEAPAEPADKEQQS